MNSSPIAIAADPRLAQLEELLRRPRGFNLLSALGLDRQELRHSALLAYLLDPRQPHGLSDAFARALLDRVAPLLPEALDVPALALTGMAVQREWGHIDILIESPADQLAIIFENKVDSGEHSDQLGRYVRLVRKHRPGWRILGIYLTLDGAPPAHERDRVLYAPLGYSDVATALDSLATAPHGEPDVQTLLRHYAQLIRSELVPDQDSDQARLARRLYIDHQDTAEAMFAARRARMEMVERFFEGLFAATTQATPDLLQRDGLFEDRSIPRLHIRFAPPEWYSPVLQVSTSWNRTKIVMLLQFLCAPRQIHFDLAVGPAPRFGRLREGLYDLARRNVPPFFPAYSDPSTVWFSIYARDIFPWGSNYFVEASDDEIRRAIREHWQDFIARDLPAIRATIRHEILGRTWDEN